MAELETEGRITRNQVAAFLREFASEIDEGRLEEGVDPEYAEDGHGDKKRITLIVGGNSATVTMPETVEFDVEIESRSPMFSSGVHQDIQFQMAWQVDDPDELTEDWLELG